MCVWPVSPAVVLSVGPAPPAGCGVAHMRTPGNQILQRSNLRAHVTARRQSAEANHTRRTMVSLGKLWANRRGRSPRVGVQWETGAESRCSNEYLVAAIHAVPSLVINIIMESAFMSPLKSMKLFTRFSQMDGNTVHPIELSTATTTTTA